MEKRRFCITICLLLLATLYTPSAAQKCIKEDRKNIHCACDDSLDSSNGWSYTCLDSNFEVLFIVKYVEDRSLTFECGEEEPDYQSIIQQLDLDNIRTYYFKSCPLPNVSFSDIIHFNQNRTIDQLKIDAKNDNRTFSSEMFQNVSDTLKSLILSNNKVTGLPESLFNNFTRLKFLSLSDNQLRNLPDNIFSNLENLLTLEITNNVLEFINVNLFHGLNSLEKLYLYKNKLKELPAHVFQGLKNLKVLDLAYNHLILLPNGVFGGLTSLVHIRLRGNWLGTVPPDLFHGSYSLKDIDLSVNRFMEPLPEELLSGLSQLESISINNCNLTLIYSSFFGDCSNMTNVELSGNSLVDLPENLFQKNSLLRQINLNFNFINQISRNLFPNHMSLETLSLFGNNISVIPTGIFRRAKNIKTLVMGKNAVQNVSQEIFQDLPNLETLDLKMNNLTYFRLDVNENIKQIDLSRNQLTEVPSLKWIQHLKLEKVNLEHNYIVYLTIPLLYSTNKFNPVLDFAHNNIKTVNVDDVLLNDEIIKKLPSKDYDNYVESRVILNHNPFVCDCHLYKFYEYLKRNNELPRRSVRFDLVQNLTCQAPQRLTGKQITTLSSSQFTCDTEGQCSSPCNCYTRAKDNSNVVNCSNHKLKVVPSILPNEINVLFFQGNNLTSMNAFNEERWLNLTDLILDDNQITNVDSWNIPLNLKNISLKGNHISHLPSSFMHFISEAQDLHLTLSDNPWNCNCSTKSLKKWLTDHYQKVKDVRDVVCNNQLQWNGTMIRPPILTAPDDVLCPISDWPYKLHMITVTVICVVLALLLFVVSVLYYRNKQTVIAYVYIHMHQVFMCFFNEKDMDNDKIFDAFVSYSSSDRDVAMMLTQELECKEPRFRLCIHERDWIAGNQISWNIINSVHNSKRTILVISKEFLESMWFQVEFHTAYYQMLEDKIDRLIIIVKGDLPPKDTLDKDLQYLLSTKTYLIWEEKWFWEKLKYAMPHKKHDLPNDVLALKDRPPSVKVRPVENQIAILSSNSNNTTDKVHQVVQSYSNAAYEPYQDNT